MKKIKIEYALDAVVRRCIILRLQEEDGVNVLRLANETLDDIINIGRAQGLIISIDEGENNV